MIKKVNFLIVMLVFLCFFSPLYAISEIYTSFLSNQAVSAYDTVAYFTKNKAVKGDSKYTYRWKQAEWFFSSQKHKDLFIANPEKYAPQYGGYCSWKVSLNGTASSDPKAWKIINDKLYLNYSLAVQKRWEKEALSNIKKADYYWPLILAH